MKQILCFGDSNTWGLDGETGKRFPWEERWTGILQEKLADRDIRIVEEGLCTHSIFYTAITRARKSLKIYWTQPVEEKVLAQITPQDHKKDVSLLKREIT